MVVILPSFTITLFKGNPFLYPIHHPLLTTTISPPHSQGNKLNSSQTNVGNTAYGDIKKLHNHKTGKIIGN